MTIVKLQGGLGNQMFQYALGRSLSLQLNTSLQLDLSFLLNRGRNEKHVFRDYELDIFNLDVKFANLKEKNNYICPYPSNPELAFWKLRKRVFKYNYYAEKKFSFDPEVISLKGNIYLDGYWQTPKYFDKVKDIILADFSFKEDMSDNFKNIADEIRDSNSICLQVRRGDYVSNPETSQFHGVKEIDYFDDAISHISRTIEDMRIYVFSDDIHWCMENIKFKFSTTFIEHEYPNGKAEEYFRLMGLCRHFIISNSTFGWWAAWLSQNQNKIVIAPKKWFKDSTINTSDLIPDNWIRI
jgi:Glycosyl transferase family 11